MINGLSADKSVDSVMATLPEATPTKRNTKEIYTHALNCGRKAVRSAIALKVESKGVGAILLGQWFQNHDRCESKVNRFPVPLEQYSNRLDCER